MVLLCVVCSLCFLCVFAFCVIHHPSNQDVGHKQSSDGGEGQRQPGHAGQTGCIVAQVGVAARLGQRVDGGVGAARGEIHVFGLVAISLC